MKAEPRPARRGMIPSFWDFFSPFQKLHTKLAVPLSGERRRPGGPPPFSPSFRYRILDLGMLAILKKKFHSAFLLHVPAATALADLREAIRRAVGDFPPVSVRQWSLG